MEDKEHKFVLLVIKDSSGIFPDRFLLRYDERWGCYLFPYLKVEGMDSRHGALNFCIGTLFFKECTAGACKVEVVTKYSNSAKKMKTYRHIFCPITFSLEASNRLPKTKTITMYGDKYTWFTIEEMKKDEMYLSNKETIDYVEKNFL